MAKVKVSASYIVPSQQEEEETSPQKREPERDALGRAYATGRRKNASARAWVKPGRGTVIVNGRDIAVYFARPVLRMIVHQPFDITKTAGQFEVFCTVEGGGLSGQAGAVRHAISRALASYDPDAYHKLLRQSGFLTRDSRAVERKKYGRRKARRRFQFSKR